MAIPEFVSPVVFSVSRYYPPVYSCKNTIEIRHFKSEICYFCLSIQLLLQFMHIIILHKFWTSHKHISNYPKIPCVSNILMKFVVYGVKLI